MATNGELYAESQERIKELVTAPGADLDAAVPACPGWTVRDLLAHLAGVPADVANDRMADFPSSAWTAYQVGERRGRSVDEILTEWDQQIAAIEPVVASPMGLGLVTEGATHEHDIRGALGQPGERESRAVQASAQIMLEGLARSIAEGGLPALRVVIDGNERVIGDGEPAGTLNASSFEVLRAISGRRTPDQVRAMDWTGNPDQWLGHFFTFGPRETPLAE